MSEDPRPQGLDWILAYEDLDATERHEADRYLADHPEIAAQIQRLRDVEAMAVREMPTTPDDGFWADSDLSAEDEARCQESARRIRALLAPPETPSKPRPWRRLQSSPRWLLPIAAVLALIVIVPQVTRHDTIMTGLTLETVAATTSVDRSADLAPLTTSTLRNGDAFVLAFELAVDSYLAVVHVDPLGQVALVYPQDQSRVVRLAGGRRHQLPDPLHEETWILAGATGRESFLVASDRKRAPSIDELKAALANRTGGRNRAEAMDAVRELLGSTWDQVEVIEFSHVE